MQIKAGKKTVSNRRVKLTKRCTYSSRVTFRLPSRLRPAKLTVRATFGGNGVMTRRTSRASTVRAR